MNTVNPPSHVDALVIGGGFYGCAIAAHLARRMGLQVQLVEAEPALMRRASYVNQARVHNGYHYPRSFTTAYRSRVNLPRFASDWPAAVKSDFTKLYAIARRNSKVNARQFRKFCEEIGARLETPNQDLRRLFDPRLIEEVFLVEEYAFDSTVLARLASDELREAGVEVKLATRAAGLSEAASGSINAIVTSVTSGEQTELACNWVFNCTYSGLNQLGGTFRGTQTKLKQEVTEMALVAMPDAMRGLGITVMDGPFFSMMPFPSRGLHTLSHVRYTPHLFWYDEPNQNPYERLAAYEKESRFDRMRRDVRRYLPAADGIRREDSLFEIKTVLVKSEADDGRPILFERHPVMPRCISVLGSKIDNIYDALEMIDGLIR